MDDRAFVAPGLVDATTWTYSFWFYPEQNPTGHYRSILHRVCHTACRPVYSNTVPVGDAGPVGRASLLKVGRVGSRRHTVPQPSTADSALVNGCRRANRIDRAAGHSRPRPRAGGVARQEPDAAARAADDRPQQRCGVRTYSQWLPLAIADRRLSEVCLALALWSAALGRLVIAAARGSCDPIEHLTPRRWTHIAIAYSLRLQELRVTFLGGSSHGGSSDCLVD